jgi:hypothetical protein
LPVTLTAAAPSCAFYSHHTTPMCDGCSSRPQPTLLISYERFTFFKPKNILKDLTLVIGADLKSKACRGKLAQSQRMQSTTRKVEFNWLHELSTSTSKRMKAEPEMIFVLTCDNVSECEPFSTLCLQGGERDSHVTEFGILFRECPHCCSLLHYCEQSYIEVNQTMQC